MVIHGGIGEALDSEYLNKLSQAGADPVFSMFKRLTSVAINPAQVGSTHAACVAVEKSFDFRVMDIFSSVGHKYISPDSVWSLDVSS